MFKVFLLRRLLLIYQFLQHATYDGFGHGFEAGISVERFVGDDTNVVIGVKAPVRHCTSDTLAEGIFLTALREAEFDDLAFVVVAERGGNTAFQVVVLDVDEAAVAPFACLCCHDCSRFRSGWLYICWVLL